jgi:hypothetical protein
MFAVDDSPSRWEIGMREIMANERVSTDSSARDQENHLRASEARSRAYMNLRSACDKISRGLGSPKTSE